MCKDIILIFHRCFYSLIFKFVHQDNISELLTTMDACQLHVDIVSILPSHHFSFYVY